jgi:hypothetical protein
VGRRQKKAQERDQADHEQRPDQRAGPSQGAVDLAVELVVLVHSEVLVERAV